MEEYIDILLEYISQERLSTMSRKHIAYLAQEEDAFTALSRTFTEEQKKLVPGLRRRPQRLCRRQRGRLCPAGLSAGEGDLP